MKSASNLPLAPLLPKTSKPTPSWMLRWPSQATLAGALLALSALMLAGCVTPTLTEQDRLLATYPDQAKAAARAGPDFVRDALHTINRLEANQK
jgi:hypothetical protein